MEIDSVGDEMTVLKDKILEHISENDEAYFKSQQKDDPDLTKGEKRKIAENILDKSLSLFLARFGKHLLEEHLKYFTVKGSTDEENYEVAFHLQEIQRSLHRNKTQAKVKNRRLEALKRLALKGEYFSEEEMKRRNPLLYEHLVGQFLTEEEKEERAFSFDYTTETLSHFLLEKYDRECTNKLLHYQRDQEDSVMEEEEDSSEEEGDGAPLYQPHLWGERKKYIPLEVSGVEKKMFFEEFRSLMYSNFLEGKDCDFDYSKVDSNTDFDDMDTEDRDEEEKYFDSETPEEVGGKTEAVEDDPLEVFMNGLHNEVTQQEINEKMKSLGT